MASVTDVYNEIVAVNGTLAQIHGDLVAETNATNQVGASVDQVDADVKAGFNAVENQLAVIAQIEAQAVGILFHLTQQADTMICALDQISRNTCAILNEATVQTRLQTRIRDDSDAMREILEFTHPDAAIQRERLAAMRAEIERCCPPEPEKPACDYEPCGRPEPIKPPELPRVPGGRQPRERR